MPTEQIIQTNISLKPAVRRRFDKFCRDRKWTKPAALEGLLDIADATEPKPPPRPVPPASA